MNLEEYQNVDYIYCLRYDNLSAGVENNANALEVNETRVECNLDKRQRSSQEILDLADFLLMHCLYPRFPILSIRKPSGNKSFSTSILPLWIELAHPKSFFEYFKHKYTGEDVMLMYEEDTSNVEEIQAFCREKEWGCTESVNVTGSEASITILYDIDKFYYELVTRAKTQLVIVTIQRLFIFFLLKIIF